MEQYIESIIIRQDSRPETETPFCVDAQCDSLFKFKGVIQLKQILKSIQNATHNRHDYIFNIVSIDELQEE
jgi:hypothetical protein